MKDVPTCALHVIEPGRVFQPQLQVSQDFLDDVTLKAVVFIVLHDQSLSVFQLGEFRCQRVLREGNLSHNTQDSIT